MKRKYIFNWEIKVIDYGSDINRITLHSGVIYLTEKIEKADLYITFLVQSENIIEDIETVVN